MGDEKIFNKYKRYGGYHWRWYGTKVTYTKSVDFIKEWVKETNVIDIGAGDGLITSILNIRGIDNDPWAIRCAAKRNVKIDYGDAYDLPYGNEEFESAIMIDVIEHFSDINKPLQEARRVIRSFLYLTIPKKEKFVEPDHYHAWTPPQLIADVEKNGFILEEGPISCNGRYYFKFKKCEV